MATIYGTSSQDNIRGDRNSVPEADTIYGYPAQATPPTTEVADRLYRPLFATAPKGDKDNLYVVSQGGTITVYDLKNPGAAAKVFLKIPDDQLDNADEAGLLGLTFHPNFATNGKCYVSYTEEGSREQVIVEYTIDLNDPNTPPASTARKIMTIDYPDTTSHHWAGWIDFGPDGMLYIATGDGWRIENTETSNANAAQTLVNEDGSINHLGKILRIDVNGDDFLEDDDRNYRIPDGTEPDEVSNPTQFQGIINGLPQASEIWAVGLRNPWRASFTADGKLIVGDVGDNGAEEINIVERGKNYGWRSAANADGPQTNSPYTNPYYSYLHSDGVGRSVTAGYVYNGPGELNGKYIFGDFVAGKIFAIDMSGSTPEFSDITSLFKDSQGQPIRFGQISSFGLDGQGNLYVISYAQSWGQENTGKIFRLSDNTPVEDVGDTLAGAGGNDTIYGGGGGDLIEGGDDDDSLYGGEGDDQISGDAGADELTGGVGNDTLGGGGSNDTLRGGGGNDLIYGDEGDDHLYGDEGDDILLGDAGIDMLAGGAGNDRYSVDGSDTIVEAAADGVDRVSTSETFALQAGSEIEVLQASDAGGTNALELTGNGFSQELIGNAGSNTLNGNGGQDTLRGGGGNDTYVADVDDTITEAENAGTDTVQTTSAHYTLAPNVENLVLLSGRTGTGNELANTITGNDAANILDGQGGADELIGGGGDDTYRIDSEGDVIVETAFGGVDTLIASTSFSLTEDARVEILKATAGDGVVNLTGNSQANTFHGNRASNTFHGGEGQDTVVFTGKRSDYTVARNASGSVTITDKRTGNTSDGSDTAFRMEIFQFSDRAMNLEGLFNTAPSNLKLNGNVVQENKKTGDFVGDVSATDSGDTLRFELTNDAGGRFRISETGRLEVANGVLLDYEQATSHTIEVLVTDSFGEGIRQTFTIDIQEQNNELATGSDLADVLKGGLFNDTFSGAAGNDTLVGSAGNDRLNGDDGNDLLEGGSGNDVLSGGSGNERLLGGTGKDSLTGGSGRDVFVFDDKETGSSKTKADYIVDFSGRGGDRLDLKLVDADAKKKGDQKFSFIGTKAFSKAGEVRYEKTKKETYVYLNTDSDKAAEAVIKLKGSLDLQKGWFVL